MERLTSKEKHIRSEWTNTPNCEQGARVERMCGSPTTETIRCTMNARDRRLRFLSLAFFSSVLPHTHSTITGTSVKLCALNIYGSKQKWMLMFYSITPACKMEFTMWKNEMNIDESTYEKFWNCQMWMALKKIPQKIPQKTPPFLLFTLMLYTSWLHLSKSITWSK